MIQAVGGQNNASAAMNVLLNELAGGPRARRMSPSAETNSTEAPTSVRGKSELTEEERREVEKLQRRDEEVRQHEAAHKAAAGAHTGGGPTYEYTTGPDGRRYATGGEVQIDTSEVPGDPQATIEKMQQIRRAASAPAEPSSQDRRVAAEAAAIEAQARAELARERSKSTTAEDGTDPTTQASSLFKSPNTSDATRNSLGPAARFDASPAEFVLPGRFIDLTV